MMFPSQIARLGPFARDLLAYSVSEAAAKASRLFVVIAVARTMEAEAIGIAAAALAASDILKALTENGAVQRIIAAPDAALESTCRTASRIFWVWCLGLFALQVAVAGALFAVGGTAVISMLIVILAAEYLFMPAGLVQVALAMREGKLRQTAAISAGQVVGANVACVALALIWPGPLALVLPRLMSAPIWLVAVRRLRPWSPDRTQPFAPLRPFVAYGGAVLGVEVVKALRLQIDKLLVGLLMGAEILGLYFMAFNAGLGLANSFALAFARVLFPHLCASDDRASALQRGLTLALRVIVPMVVLQSLAAPFYVPVLFGPEWQDLSGVVAILCLAAIPGVVWSAAAQWLRAENRPDLEFVATLAMTAALIANTALMAPYGLTALAWGYLVTATVTQLLAALLPLAGALKPAAAEV
ncbi:oligosaccharide flippase family protein [Tropicimonas isoalkanivorans]|uniref:Polysaccharide transporter, PST family n=1 Tax=Tropicimonas isoalkanivorans TaxID=441112 RepID=A0A1I1GJD4_9RHOB|nr:oligosaccharide flippase family protein [Tropicimonas isoalkanivorans]SFC09443.1 polysaccharide transporter, PST family [Tropicimonas isoalkanivorans]